MARSVEEADAGERRRRRQRGFAATHACLLGHAAPPRARQRLDEETVGFLHSRGSRKLDYGLLKKKIKDHILIESMQYNSKEALLVSTWEHTHQSAIRRHCGSAPIKVMINTSWFS